MRLDLYNPSGPNIRQPAAQVSFTWIEQLIFKCGSRMDRQRSTRVFSHILKIPSQTCCFFGQQPPIQLKNIIIQAELQASATCLESCLTALIRCCGSLSVLVGPRCGSPPLSRKRRNGQAPGDGKPLKLLQKAISKAGTPPSFPENSWNICIHISIIIICSYCMLL